MAFAARGAAHAETPLATILATYARANAAAPRAFEASGTIDGAGLHGAFHVWRDGDDERDDEALGPRAETTLRHGARWWVRNADGNVRELRGILRRRALTDAFVASGAFVRAPERVRVLRDTRIAGRPVWRIEVRADGGEAETLAIDRATGLLVRSETVDGDGTSATTYDDWRLVDGVRFAFRSVVSDGDHAFDVVERTTAVRSGGPIDPAIFAPLSGRTLAGAVQSVDLLALGGHLGCAVTIAGRSYTFLVDSGAQSIVLDARVAAELQLPLAGALEVRGAARIGGLRLARLPRLEIGTAALDDLVVSVLRLDESIGGRRIDGILGYPFFAAALVELDPGARRMRFGPPGAFVPAGERLALDVDREIPEVLLRIDEGPEAPFLIDTGNSGGLLLYAPFAVAHPELTARRAAAARNLGIGGSNGTYAIRLRSLRGGPLDLAEPEAHVVLATSGAFADRIDAGNVGLGVLRRYVVTFDLGAAALWLAPATEP